MSDPSSAENLPDGPPSPAADALYARAQLHLPGGNSRTTVFVPPHPPYALYGRGYVLSDVDGHEVIDLQNNYTALLHGHAHPALVRAAVDAVEDGASMGLPTRYEVDLADALAGRVAVGERWRFANSGTEAVMVAIRLARAVTGRDTIVRFAGCYHGSHDAVIDGASPGVPAGVSRDVIELPVGDEHALAQAIDRDGDRIAAVLFDAMPNRAGLRPATPEFAELLRRRTRERGILLIQDEVLTFRVAYGGLHSQYDYEPDIVTLGKVIGGGFPVGAIGGRAEIMDAFDPRRPGAVGHGGTFSANPVTLRAGLTALELYDREAVGRLNGLGERLRGQLAGQGWSVSGRGSLIRVHVADPSRWWWQLYRRGALACANGLLSLSTPMDDAVIDRVSDVFASIREEASVA